jgi:hypothetical protein
MAVGARVSRLCRQLATESAVLVVTAAALGIIGSAWLGWYLRGLTLFREAQWNNVTLMDWRVVSAIIVYLLLLTLLVSLAPMLGIQTARISDASRQHKARASLAQRLAGSAQIAVAGMLGGAAMAFGWYVVVLIYGNSGYDTKDLYLVETSSGSFLTSADARRLDAARWREAVEAIPGVSAVAYGRPVPGAELSRFPIQMPSPIEPDQQIEIFQGEIERGFVDALGLRVIRGRIPLGQEPGVVVVNQALARMIWGRDEVVGETLFGSPLFGNVANGEGSEIVGVLEDISYGHPSAAAKPYAFRAYAGIDSVVIRSELSQAQLQQALDALNASGVNVTSVRSIASMTAGLIAADRARAFLTLAAAVVVLLLAAFGFYGLQGYLVSAGRREYAIRTSLGAGPRAIASLVMIRGLSLASPGVIIGGLMAFIWVNWMRDEYLSRDVSSGTIGWAVVFGLVLLVFAASIGPARYAGSMSPAGQLRED